MNMKNVLIIRITTLILFNTITPAYAVRCRDL